MYTLKFGRVTLNHLTKEDLHDWTAWLDSHKESYEVIKEK